MYIEAYVYLFLQFCYFKVIFPILHPSFFNVGAAFNYHLFSLRLKLVEDDAHQKNKTKWMQSKIKQP